MDENGKPLVTVIMPSYGHGKYVRQAVESIFAESYRPLELVVVDDSSPDDSPEILKELHKDAPIPFQLELFEKNQGAPTALNRCLELARGEFIALCASDDMHIPGAMEKMVDVLLGDGSVQVVYANGWIMEGETLTEKAMQNDASLAFLNDAPKGSLERLLTGNFPMWFQTGISRAGMVRTVGGWNAKRKADDGPRARRVYRYLAEHDLNHAYINVPYYIYRTHETNMHKDAAKMREHILDAIEGEYPEEIRTQVLYRTLIRQMRVCLENDNTRDAVRTLGHLLDDIDDAKLDAFLLPRLMAFSKDCEEAVRNPESGEWGAGEALHERVRRQKAKFKEQRERIEGYRARGAEQKEEIRRLKRSASWKIGRMFTKPFRMFRSQPDR